MSSQSPLIADDVKDEEPDVKNEDAGGDAGNVPTPSATPTILSKKELEVIMGVVSRLTEYRTPEFVLQYPTRRNADARHRGHDVSGLFQRMLNKRLIPDYFDVIKEPMAFSTIRV